MFCRESGVLQVTATVVSRRPELLYPTIRGKFHVQEMDFAQPQESLKRESQSGARPHPHLETVEAKFGHLEPRMRV